MRVCAGRKADAIFAFEKAARLDQAGAAHGRHRHDRDGAKGKAFAHAVRLVGDDVRYREIGLAIAQPVARRSEEHTSELQSLMRNSYAVFCLQKKKNKNKDKRT